MSGIKEQTIYRFKVLAGSFWDHIKKVDYNRGDEVHSTKRLDLMFKNAFELLDDLESIKEVVAKLPEFDHRWQTLRRGSRYDVIHQDDGRTLNDKCLKREEADAIVSPNWDEPWTVPKMWDGQTVFILGGGPSLAQMDLEPIKNGRVIGTNDAYILGDWVDICYFGDVHWLNKHQEAFKEWPGLKVTNNEDLRGRAGILTTLRGSTGYTTPDRVTWGNNTGVSACYFAVMLGAAQIVLLGFDMKLGEKGESNWHPNELTSNGERTYKEFRYRFQQFEAVTKRTHPEVRLINSTPDTAMEAFEKVPLEEVLKG